MLLCDALVIIRYGIHLQGEKYTKCSVQRQEFFLPDSNAAVYTAYVNECASSRTGHVPPGNGIWSMYLSHTSYPEL